MAAEKLIISTLEPVEVGQKFKKLPLHVTLMPWFEINRKNMPTLHELLGLIATKRTNLDLIGEEIAMFGPDNETEVRKLQRTDELVRMHSDLSAAVLWSDGEKKSEYIHENYSPHISFVDGISLGKGRKAEINAFQLVRKHPITRKKRVEQVFPLAAPLESDTKD